MSRQLYDDDQKAELTRERRVREFDKARWLVIQNVVTELLKLREGRVFLNWLLEETKAVGVTPFTGNALTTAYQCGEQRVGHEILDTILSINPDGFVKMMQEVNEDEQRTEPDTGTDSGTDA